MVNRGVIGTGNRLLLAPLAKCPGPWRVPPMLVPMYRSVMGPEWMSTWWRSILTWAGEAVLVWWRKICWGRGAPVDRDPSVALIWADAVERPAVDDAVDVEAASPTGADAWGWSTATYKQNHEWASAPLKIGNRNYPILTVWTSSLLTNLPLIWEQTSLKARVK